MADVVLDARMSNEELLGSIDKVLGNMEKKFDASVNNINAKLATIGSNLGQGLMSNLNSQLNSTEKKIDELQNKANRSSSSSASTKSININDNNNAIINGFQTQDFELLQLNEHYRQLEISSKRAFDSQKQSIKEQNANGFQTQNFELIQLNEYYKQLEVSSKRAAEAQAKIFKGQRADAKMDLSSALKMPTNDIDEVNAKLKRLQDIKSKISSSQRPLLNPSEIQGIDTQISNLNKKLEILQAKVKQPLSFNNVMSMPTGDLNDISAKMKAITNLRGQYAANAPELVQLNQAYQRLSNMQKEALTAGIQLEKHNNKLSTSFENLGKRVIFYAGLGALTGFVEQLYDIRGQYEMLERSMGALLGDFAKGSALFNQIQAQALKSPFTVIDLSSAAKQLLAYNFAEGQVADTTKRLADISSALGVPIERLVYNTGQIKAKGFLDSRDARDYANSGLAIVPMLAKLYTEQKRNGEQAVTTSEVYDMMTKKMVSYGDVMAVINKATNDGGMFFDFQAKQAETLKGQMSNLVDAWNLMLNQIGKDNQGVLTGSVSLARTLFTNWREVENVILSLITAYGAYKTSQIVMNTLIGQGNTTITNSIIANKLKMASDLQRASLTRTLTTEENAFLLTRNKVTASDYAAALSTKGLRKEQLLLLATFNMRNTAFLQGLIRSNLLTAAEVRGALSAKGLSLAFNVLTLSAKTLGKSILGLLISNAPMIALTAIVGIISSMVAKHEEYKQKIKDVNDEYNNLRKNIADISVNFKIALLQKDNKGIDEARNQLNELIKLSKEQYNITFNIDTSKLNPKQIVETFNQIKNELDNLSIASRQFADSAIESNLGNTWDKYGQSIGKVYDIISSNKSVVVDALQSHINKLKQLGASQKDIQAEQLILNELMTPKKDNESQFDYLKRLVVAYNQLGIIGSNTDLFDKSTDQLRKLGIAGDETFKTLNTDWSELMSTGGDAIKAFNSQIDELAKRINLNALPKEQRTLQLEAAINKFATDKNLNEWSREAMLRLANEKYHTTIKIVDDKPSEDKTEFDIKSWQGRLQNWANRNKIILGLTLTVETTEVQAAQEALQKVQTAQEAVEIVKRKIKQGTASAVDLDAAKKNYKQQLEIAKAAGSDLSSLNKKADAERRKAEAAQKKALSEEAQAIKNEIDLIDKLSSNYDKLTKAGMSSTDAISLLNDEYKNSITAINSVLGKYKLPDFNVKEFAGKDVSGQLDYLEKLRNAMKTKGLDKLKPDAFKEVSVQIQKIKVEGKVYDLTKITDGLQESLSNIKESYELGIEIDTESGLGDVFSTMFGIDRSKLPKDAEDAVKQMTDEWNKAVDRYNAVNIKSPIKKIDILSTTPQQFNEIQNVNVKSGIAENYKKVFDTVYGIAKADAEKTIKEYNDLNYKLADNAGKIGIEEQKLSLLQTRYAQETNNEKKRLLELQITDEKRTIEQLKEESLKLVPFYRDLFADTYNKSNATLERIIEKVKEVTNTAKEVDVNGEKKIQLSFPDQSGEIKKTTISAEEYLRILKQIDSLTQKTTESNPWKKISDDFSKVTIDGKTQLKNPKEGLKDLAAEGHKAADGVKELSQIFSDLGASDDTVETLSDIGTTIDGISTAAEGAAQIASGDVIGGTVNVIKGTWTAVSTWFDNKNKKIDKQIKESELTVKNLENAYKNLEYAVSHSLGTDETMAKKAEIANKKLLLTELQRQLTLEESRSGKKKDESKIADLKGQIIDTENDIKDLTDSIVNDLLGTDIKSAAEDFAKTWITAWQQGENTIESLKSKFTDMIDTMIVKSLASAIVAKRLQGIYDLVTQFTDDKSEGGVALTTDEINIIRQKTGSNLVDKINQDLTNVMNALGINYGSGNNNNLSDLQQGIQSVSEETAGALEGYMNGVSGQVYLHTTQLQQLLNNSNVSLGVQSQILLALQNGYQVQQSIQGLLEGWSSSNGRSIKVEMIK